MGYSPVMYDLIDSRVDGSTKLVDSFIRNQAEHRMFCHITKNWRGRPLVTEETVVQLIGATTTSKGLRIKAAMDKRSYPLGIEVSKERMKALNLEENEFNGHWNYEISPQVTTK